MNPRLLILSVILIAISISCRKKQIGFRDHTEYVGDYHFSYSLDGSNSESFQTIDGQYGIRITKSAHVEFWENGERIHRKKIIEIGKPRLVIKWDKWNDRNVYLSPSRIKFSSWPAEDQMNYFDR